MSGWNPTRRALLAGAGSLLLAPSARATARPRVAVVDWALLETLLALGHAPEAAVELKLFSRVAIEPVVPAGVADLGLRGSINFERVASLRPDLIYGSNYSGWANEMLARIAPVRELTIYVAGEKPFPKAVEAMDAIADDLGKRRQAKRYLDETRAEIEALRLELAPHTERPLLIANLGDARHFRAFGEDSMFGDVAARLGFANAWGPRTSYSATAPVGIERIAEMGDSILAIVGPVPPEARDRLPHSALWRAMPPVREGRAVTLDPINPFGGLPAARRFARLLAEGLRAS